MFIGEYSHTLDAKGRVILPAKFRDGLGEKFVLTKGLDNCLFIYSMDEWKTFEDRLKTLPLTNKDARNFIRFFFAGAIECEVDKQGRILVSQNLREYASLIKDIVIIGVSTRIEIWDKEKWENYTSQDNLDPDEIAKQMSLLGI